MPRDDAELSTIHRQGEDVVIEAFADETIAVHLGTGRYYTIDLIGAETLDPLARGWDLPAIAQYLALRYDADEAVVSDAIEGFTRQLLDERLICPAPESSAAAPVPAPERATGPFTAPTIAVYTDMEDLLLLDPIHDVDETGWPARSDLPASPPVDPLDAG